MRHLLTFITIVLFLCCFSPMRSSAATHPYDGQLNHDIKRDRIIAISEDYSTLYYYVGPQNIDYSTYTGATCPDPTVGWKTGAKYCWGGEDTTAIYLLRLTEGDGAGNRNTGSSSSYDLYATGTDCSGMASVCWTSPRRATSGFGGISDDVTYETLRMGDCTNYAGSHIRIFDYYTGANTLMFYESTSGSGRLWKSVHRSLSRDNRYVPIRYHYTYKVYDYPEPVITAVRRTGVERVNVRWDGQADVGFRLYQSSDGNTFTRVRDTADLPPTSRDCEVSGLAPGSTVYFRMTSVNSGGETIPSAVAAARLNDFDAQVLLVDGADRYREQTGAPDTFATRVGAALGALGVGFDTCANEAVVDEMVDLNDYQAVVWVLAEESTFDETFSWPEQRHIQAYLQAGGRLFVSGSEITWDLDHMAGSHTYKNDHVNDKPFCNDYLRAGYAGDDAGTYQVTGAAGSIFAGLNFSFDDGSHGTYDVQAPDQLTPLGGTTAGLTYQGGAGGTACVYGSSPTAGTVVTLGFGYETIYPETSRQEVLHAIFGYFDAPVVAPTMKSVLQTSADEATVTWDGYGSLGFRLIQKTGAGPWTRVLGEGSLGPQAHSAIISGLTAGTPYAFKVEAVNSAEASADSDVLCFSPQSSGPAILLVDGYDRWNSQSAGVNQVWLEKYAAALTANGMAYASCTNEAVSGGTVALQSYDAVMWMCGEESTESETFGAAEQLAVQDYLRAGGKLFVSGSEIGWDLVQKGGTANDYSNGTSNDTPFFQSILKAGFVADDANEYTVGGEAGTVFDGLSFAFDDGTHGTYDVAYPDVLTANDGGVACLHYGSGTSVAGVTFRGLFPSGTAEGRLVYFAFPFETIYDTSSSTAVMRAVLEYFGFLDLHVNGWQFH